VTTTTWASVVDQTTDAAFRTWGAEFAAKLLVVGLTQTADTGQINWASVTRAGANTAAGYEIWRFADSSLYMKIEYGSAGANTQPQLWITVGTGSNGSGTLTGQTSTRGVFGCGLAISSTVTSYTSYMSRTADSFSVAWKVAGAGAAYVLATLVVGKTVDGTGAATTTGFGVWRQNGNGAMSLQSVRIASTAATYVDNTLGYCSIPGLPTTSAAGANFQAYACYVNVPDVQPFNWGTGVVTADIPRGVSFTTAMVGTTTRTFLSLGSTNASANIGTFTAGTYSIAIIYE
jgi:hypothetical protein